MRDGIKVGDTVHLVGERLQMSVEEIKSDGTAICVGNGLRDRYQIADLRRGEYPPMNIAYKSKDEL